MVGPASKRRAVKHVVETGLGNPAQACRALSLARSTFYHASKPAKKSQQLRRQIVALSRKHPRYGYRRITALLRHAGSQVNAKRVQRIRRREDLQVSRRQRRCKRAGISTAERQRAATSVGWTTSSLSVNCLPPTGGRSVCPVGCSLRVSRVVRLAATSFCGRGLLVGALPGFRSASDRWSRKRSLIRR